VSTKASKVTENTVVRKLEGPVTVAFSQLADEWYATALEFDLVGTGASREAALRQLKAVVKTHFETLLTTPGKVRFFNPSDADEWNIEDKEYFTMTITIARAVRLQDQIPDHLSFAKARRYRKAIRSVEMLHCAGYA
jgi:hypothetical protein